MKLKIIVLSFLIVAGIGVQAKTFFQKFDRAQLYAVIKTGNKSAIDEELAAVTSSDISQKEAYEGFLLMRKAGIVTLPAEKLKLFKQGRIKFETALQGDADNAEYHFLRLIIEEKAPKIVKYNKDIEADKAIVVKAYKNLPAVVQQAILDYSKSSKVLQAQDF